MPRPPGTHVPGWILAALRSKPEPGAPNPPAAGALGWECAGAARRRKRERAAEGGSYCAHPAQKQRFKGGHPQDSAWLLDDVFLFRTTMAGSAGYGQRDLVHPPVGAFYRDGIAFHLGIAVERLSVDRVIRIQQ